MPTWTPDCRSRPSRTGASRPVGINSPISGSRSLTMTLLMASIFGRRYSTAGFTPISLAPKPGFAALGDAVVTVLRMRRIGDDIGRRAAKARDAKFVEMGKLNRDAAEI